MRALVLAVLVLPTIVPVLRGQPAAVTRAFAGSDHLVHIVAANGAERILPPEKGQDGIENVRLAGDGETVGWLVDLPASCCVSYPIPIELVIWRSGHVIRRISPVQAIFGWAFLNGGKEVAYHTAPLHGSEIYHCDRADVQTGKVLEQWWIGKSKPPPKWVELLDAQFPMPDDDQDADEPPAPREN